MEEETPLSLGRSFSMERADWENRRTPETGSFADVTGMNPPAVDTVAAVATEYVTYSLTDCPLLVHILS